MNRSVLAFCVVGGVCVALVVLQPPARRQYIATPPPDTVSYQPAKLDSITHVVFRCFGKVAEVRWFVTDSALGTTDANGRLEPATGRYFPRSRAVVMRRGHEHDPSLIFHELLHPTSGRLDHPPAIFARVC